MKRETIYWILLLGVLIGISTIYTNSQHFDEPRLIEQTNSSFRTIQIGDLYILKDKTQKVVKFFKIAGSPKSDSVFVLRGNPSYNENIIDSEWIKKIIDRPIYFDPNLQRVAKKSLSLIHYEEGINFTLYRQVYPAEYYPLIIYLVYSPLTIILLILSAFFIIWMADIVSLYLHSFFPKIPRAFYWFLLGFLIATILGWIQWNGYVVYLESQNLEVPSSIWFPTALKNLLEILPVFGLFYFLKKKYLRNLNLTGQKRLI